MTNGLVEGIKAGTATITATVNGITETVQVTVTDPVIELIDQQSTIQVSGATCVLTKKATLKVETMKEDTEIYKRVKEVTNGQFLLVDIQLLNKLGESMQPNGTVKVVIFTTYWRTILSILTHHWWSTASCRSHCLY